ncbi:MAG TPA: PLP-dependent transferase, partial [Myxococcota bacterium]|nr:PLP-dependent transferase [Myxococcota bacterium]
ALTLARHLEKQSQVDKVGYVGLESHPQYALTRGQMQGGSSIVALHLKGDKAAAFRFMNGLELVSISNNLGDSKSLVTHPATTTHHRLTPEDRLRVGITDATVRLSVGLEDPDDITEDVMRALATV